MSQATKTEPSEESPEAEWARIRLPMAVDDLALILEGFVKASDKAEVLLHARAERGDLVIFYEQ